MQCSNLLNSLNLMIDNNNISTKHFSAGLKRKRIFPFKLKNNVPNWFVKEKAAEELQAQFQLNMEEANVWLMVRLFKSWALTEVSSDEEKK